MAHYSCTRRIYESRKARIEVDTTLNAPGGRDQGSSSIYTSIQIYWHIRVPTLLSSMFNVERHGEVLNPSSCSRNFYPLPTQRCKITAARYMLLGSHTTSQVFFRAKNLPIGESCTTSIE